MAAYDWLVVGAGFAGAVLAERLADAGERVLVVDRRSHVGGNAYDERDAAGILVHRYGPHIFHTNSDAVVAYLSRFTAWRPYEHRVLARVDGRLLPMPINRTTLEELYGVDLPTDDDAAAFLAARAEPPACGRAPRSSEEAVVASVGRDLYERFFQGYTRKQWGLDPSELDASVAARVPARTDRDDRYFTDTFQAMPREGYSALFARLLDHPRITVRTGVEHRDVRPGTARRLAWTGPLDELFDWRFGPLPYRSLEFRSETFRGGPCQPVGTINEPAEDVPYTRTTEFGHLTGEWTGHTTLLREYPRADGDPYYPIPRPETAALADRYRELAASRPDIVLLGRLATYRYYNMDQVVAQALATFRRIRDGEGVAA